MCLSPRTFDLMDTDNLPTRRSYADPIGPVYQTPQGYVRPLGSDSAASMADLFSAPFFVKAAADQVLPDARLELGEHPQIVSKAIESLTYPFEWCPRQLLAAGRLTVELAI